MTDDGLSIEAASELLDSSWAKRYCGMRFVEKSERDANYIIIYSDSS
jgi:hypothetical protein